MTIDLRLEQPADYSEVEIITREAFWGRGIPRCDEHYLAHLLRKSPSFVPELDYVAEIDGRLVGNVMFCRARIVQPDGTEHEVLDFGPISVPPEYQNMGVGRALLCCAIEEAKALGYRAIVFFGEPDYYPRLGFRRAAEFNLTMSWGGTLDAFMAMPLYEGALDGISGSFHEDTVYTVDEHEAAEYDKLFTHKADYIPTLIDVLTDINGKELQNILFENKITLLDNLRNFSGREIASFPGMRTEWLSLINDCLKQYGQPEKVWPQ